MASALQKEGIIRYAYGRVNVLDRARLELDACERYRTVEDLFAQLEASYAATEAFDDTASDSSAGRCSIRAAAVRLQRSSGRAPALRPGIPRKTADTSGCRIPDFGTATPPPVGAAF